MKKIILPKIEFEEKGDIKNFQLSEIKVIQKEGVRTFLSFIPFPIEVLASTDFTSSEIDRVIVSINRGELPTYNRKQANVFSQDRKDLDNILKETVIEAASKRLDFLSTDELKIFLDGVLEHARTGKCLLLGEDKCEACIVIKNIEFN